MKKNRNKTISISYIVCDTCKKEVTEENYSNRCSSCGDDTCGNCVHLGKDGFELNYHLKGDCWYLCPKCSATAVFESVPDECPLTGENVEYYFPINKETKEKLSLLYW